MTSHYTVAISLLVFGFAFPFLCAYLGMPVKPWRDDWWW